MNEKIEDILYKYVKNEFKNIENFLKKGHKNYKIYKPLLKIDRSAIKKSKFNKYEESKKNEWNFEFKKIK